MEVAAHHGAALAVWARAAELWTLSAAGENVTTGQEQAILPFLGRAVLPRRKRVPLLDTRRGPDHNVPVPFGSSEVVRILETLAALWRRIDTGAQQHWRKAFVDMRTRQQC